MASLNTLRTKFGVALSIIIALALLAFILSLKTEMGFTGNDPKVGVIDSEKITYSEYYEQYEQIKQQSGARDNDEQQAQMLSNAAWQALFSKYVLDPGFAKMGLMLSPAERVAYISGEIPSQAFYNAFADPRTGQFDVAAVEEFLVQAETNPEAAMAWTQLCEQLRQEIESTKYMGLVRGGVYVNALEVAQGVKAANRTLSGKWIGKKYSEVPDSLFTVTNAEMKAYYKEHKELYKQTPSRTLSYVLFEVAPTPGDMQALEEEVKRVGEEFAATNELKSFVRANRYGKVAEAYLSKAQLSDEEAEVLLAGKCYGPVLKNNEWTMSRVLDTKQVADSIGVRHIVLPYTEEQLADSLLTALKGGADFAEAAANYSVYEATAANGGEVGVLPFSAFTGEFAEALTGVKKGDIVKVASGDAIQLMQIYRADKPSKHIQIASITYPVVASEATRRDVHNHAGTFSSNAKGSMEAFNEAATAAAISPRVAQLMQGERMIRGLEESREVARWAHGAKKGELSEIFNVGDDYLLAVVTEISDKEYTPFEQVAVQIRAQLLREKKYAHILAEVAGETLAEQAESLSSEVNDFDSVTASSYYLPGIGVEPRLIGAIAQAEQGVVSAPVQGLTGLYIFQVEAIDTEEKQTSEGERVRAQAQAENMAIQRSFAALQQLAEIEDLRGEYF